MQQKGDKGAAKIEREEKQLARVLRVRNALITQRSIKGKLK